MDRVIVAYRNGAGLHAGNGTKPCGPPARVTALSEHARERALAPVRTQVDQLAGLRDLLRQAELAERELTAEVLAALQAAGLSRLEGHRATAVIGERVTMTVDPQLFCEALGPRAYDAVCIRLEAARRLLAADDLEAISEATTVPVLRLEPLSPTKASRGAA